LQYPYLVLVNSLIPAILAGNAVILKPSPQTPTVVEEVAAAFAEAGLPENVLQYTHCGSPEMLEKLVRSPLVNHICFTGSVAGGLAVQKAAADRIVSVGLELGGKDPAYVRDDVDVAWAAEEIVDGAIFNSGQSCCAIERVYVHKNIYETFIAEVKKVLSKYRVGDPSEKTTQIGPVISKRAREMILTHIAEAIEKGARDEAPANETFDNLPANGNYVKPTLLTDVNHNMRVMTEETFGPVLPVMKVESDEEAVKLMNDSEFGLTASIWTKDVPKAEGLIEQVEAGTVFINRSDYPSPVSSTHSAVSYSTKMTIDMSVGSCMDRLEELRSWCHAEQVRIRAIREAQELSCQGLSEIDNSYMTCYPSLTAIGIEYQEVRLNRRTIEIDPGNNNITGRSQSMEKNLRNG
jgi:acyl-CoA reductase-like NAD-dependent aldehyde dehydrogenase